MVRTGTQRATRWSSSAQRRGLQAIARVGIASGTGWVGASGSATVHRGRGWRRVEVAGGRQIQGVIRASVHKTVLVAPAGITGAGHVAAARKSVRHFNAMAQLGQDFGMGGKKTQATSSRVKARYTALEECQVRKTADTKSAKVAKVKPGETVEVIEIGSTNSKGRTRLKIIDPPGWISDRNNAGKELLSMITEKSGWSTGSIDMSAFEPGGLGRVSTDLENLEHMPSTEESPTDEAFAVAGSAESSPLAGSVSELGAPPGAVAPQPTSGVAQATVPSAFGQASAATTVFIQPTTFPAFGQPMATGGVPGKAEANAAMLPVIATLPEAGFAYMAGWVAEQGSEFQAAVSAARQAHLQVPAAAFGSGTASF